MLLVSWTRVEPGKIQPIKAMGPQERGNRLDEGPASLRVGGNPGKSLRAKVPSSNRQEGLQVGVSVGQDSGEKRGGEKLS